MKPVDPCIEPSLADMAKDTPLPRGIGASSRQAISKTPYLIRLAEERRRNGLNRRSYGVAGRAPCTVARPRSQAFLLLALATSLASACAHPSEKARQPHSKAMAARTASISTEDLEARLLRYAGSLKTPADMDYRHMESALGIEFSAPSDLAHPWREVKGAPLANGFTLYATHSFSAKGFSRIEIIVSPPGGKDPTRTPTEICIMDAAALSRKLEAIGYERGVQRPFQGGWMRQHWRPIGDSGQGFSVALLIYRSGGEASSRECAYGAQIDGGDA